MDNVIWMLYTYILPKAKEQEDPGGAVLGANISTC